MLIPQKVAKSKSAETNNVNSDILKNTDMDNNANIRADAYTNM